MICTWFLHLKYIFSSKWIFNIWKVLFEILVVDLLTAYVIVNWSRWHMVYDVWCHVYLLLSEIPHRKMFFFSFSFFFFFFVFLVCPFGQSLSLLSVDLSFLLENLALSLHPLLNRSNHCIDANIRNHLYKCKDAMIATTNISNICNCELLAMCFLWRFLVVTTLCVCYWWVGEMKTKWQSATLFQIDPHHVPPIIDSVYNGLVSFDGQIWNLGGRFSGPRLLCFKFKTITTDVAPLATDLAPRQSIQHHRH